MEVKYSYRTSETFVAGNGKVVCYEDIFKGIYDALVYYSRKYRKLSEDDLLDMAQKASLKVLESRGNFRPEKLTDAHSFGWSAMRSCVMDVVCPRRSKTDGEPIRREKLVLTFSEMPSFDSPEGDLLRYAVDPWSSADRKAIDDDLRALVNGRVESMNERYRDILRLHMAGYPSGEIAEMNGESAKVTYTTLSRATREVMGMPRRSATISRVTTSRAIFTAVAI